MVRIPQTKAVAQVKPRDFAKNPRTLREALETIRAHARHGDAAKKLYQDHLGRACVIGVLFTQQQRDWIVSHGANKFSVQQLGPLVGRRNLEAVTGLTLAQAEKIQDLNDYQRGPDKLLASVSAILLQGHGVIDGVDFRL